MSTQPNSSTNVITIVTGLPRSGTSVMMQMLHAGGIPALTDEQRKRDDDNPRGYFEYEPVKKLKTDKSWLPLAEGKVVKMVHLLLLDLPVDRSYRVVFMRRDLKEVVASQRKMLQRSGKAGAAIADEQLMKIYETQIKQVKSHLANHPNVFALHEVSYNTLMSDSKATIASINSFLGGSLDEAKMPAAIDPGLYRNRS